jgi:hypothetical protein
VKTVPEMLRDAAAIYEQRNAIYKDNYKRFGDIFVQLMPEGVTLQTPDDFNRFSLLVQVVAKMTRYGQNFVAGGHVDSLDDMVVYGMMLQEVDGEAKAPKPTGGTAIRTFTMDEAPAGFFSHGQPHTTTPGTLAVDRSPAGTVVKATGSPKPAEWYGGEGRQQELNAYVRECLRNGERPDVLSNWALLNIVNKAMSPSKIVDDMLRLLDNNALFGAIEDVMNDHGYIVIGGINDPQSEWTYQSISKVDVGLFNGGGNG